MKQLTNEEQMLVCIVMNLLRYGKIRISSPNRDVIDVVTEEYNKVKKDEGTKQ